MTTDLNEQLAAARSEARKLHDKLALRTQDFDAAVAEHRFAEAEQLKAELPPMREAWALAEARARALADVLDQLAQEQSQREREAAERERRRQFQEQLNAARAAEESAMAEVRRHWADVEPTLAAARESMRAAVAAEDKVLAARRDVHSAQMALGEVEQQRYIGGDSYASAKIDADRILHAFYHGHQL